MARPTKKGIDYYPKDVNAKYDTKFKYVESKNSVIARLVIYELWDLIYGEEGYYVKFDNVKRVLFLGDLPITDDQLSEIIESCLEIDLFNREIYEKYSILTSESIQKRYLEAVGRRTNVLIISDLYLLQNDYSNIKLVNVDNNLINVSNNSVNVNAGTQSKVKESKVNKSKVKHHLADDSEYQNLVDLYQSNFGPITQFVSQDLQYNLNDFGYELVHEAMKRAAFNQKRYSYAVGILKDWASNNIDDIDKVNAQDLEHKQKISSYSSNTSKVGQVPEWAKEPQKAEATQEEMDALEERFKKLEQREVTD